MKRRLLIFALVAGMLAIPALVYAGNSNPLCNLVPRYSLEWYVMLCNLTEDPPGSEG